MLLIIHIAYVQYSVLIVIPPYILVLKSYYYMNRRDMARSLPSSLPFPSLLINLKEQKTTENGPFCGGKRGLDSIERTGMPVILPVSSIFHARLPSFGPCRGLRYSSYYGTRYQYTFA